MNQFYIFFLEIEFTQSETMEILLDVKKAALAMSSSEHWVRDLIDAGLVKPVMNGKKYLIPVTQLECIANDYQGLQLRTVEDMVIAKRIVEKRRN